MSAKKGRKVHKNLAESPDKIPIRGTKKTPSGPPDFKLSKTSEQLATLPTGNIISEDNFRVTEYLKLALFTGLEDKDKVETELERPAF